MKESYKPLLTPWKIGRVELKNRIVLTSMGGTDLFGWMEWNHFDKDGARFILEVAKNNAGLVLPGCQPVYNPMYGQWLHKNKKMYDDLAKWMPEFHKTGAKLFVQLTAGFPYMMQLVGYRTWDVSENSPQISASDVQQGSLLARMELRDRILETTYRELSDKDIEFLLAMLPDSGPSRVSEIAKRMGVASNYASQYKRRLLEDGVIGERGRGLVGFDIPAFREFLSEKVS